MRGKDDIDELRRAVCKDKQTFIYEGIHIVISLNNDIKIIRREMVASAREMAVN